jgi:2-keto-4-pentenoate hydratase/2-oxohepta-3-ene-1,7-dioic acid hydratase in catechol pathway
MRFASYRDSSGPVVGVVHDDGVTVSKVFLRGSSQPVRDLVTVIEDWPAVRSELILSESTATLDELELLPPVQTSRNVICVGRNYRDHAAEFARSGFDASDHGGNVANGSAPAYPVVFTKAATSVIAAGVPIETHEGVTGAVDYEGELAVIIGRPGRGIAVADAWEHVWGYALFNDVTARDLQRDHKQWFLGKSLDTFGPLGPFAVTADAVDTDALRITTHVNGELRQDAALKDLIFDIPQLIATISAGMTLQPGDVIATGTPAGVGIGFEPPRYLRPGDVVSVSASGLGTLTNPVRAVPVSVSSAIGTPDRSGGRRSSGS